MREHLTTLGFTMIVLTLLGGVVYNTGFESGLRQAALAREAFEKENRKQALFPESLFSSRERGEIPTLNFSSKNSRDGRSVTLYGKNFSTTSRIFLNGKENKEYTDSEGTVLSSTSIRLTLPKRPDKGRDFKIEIKGEKGTSSALHVEVK